MTSLISYNVIYAIECMSNFIMSNNFRVLMPKYSKRVFESRPT